MSSYGSYEATQPRGSIAVPVIRAERTVAADRAVGLREGRVRVAEDDVAAGHDVVAPVGLDERRARLHRLLRVAADGQLLVVDLDQVERRVGGEPVLGDDRRDRLADVARPVDAEGVPLDALRTDRGRVVRLRDRVHALLDLGTR